MANSQDANGRDGDWDATVEPTLITPRWLAAAENVGSDCGGPHPNVDISSLTFDRTTGAAIELTDWLNTRAVQRTTGEGGPYTTLLPAFRRFLLARAAQPEPDCEGVAQDQEFWDVGLDRTGLAFTPLLAHVVMACGDTVTVPWRDLQPWLNPRGKAGAATVR